MQKTCFGCVVYKEALDYLPEFFESIFSQDDNKFDLLVLNDNIDKDVLEKLVNKFNNRNANAVIVQSEAHSLVKLRVELLKAAKKRNYRLMILGDCDDKFACDRVRKNRITYMNNKSRMFYYNDLKKFDGSLAMKSLPNVTSKIEEIGECNYLGMSNSAINLDMLDMEFIESFNECNSNIFDWYIFSRILLSGGIGVKVIDTYTYYRIHANNLVGLNSEEPDNIAREKMIKLEHYRLLKQYSEYMNHLYECYKSSKIDFIKKNPYEVSEQFWWSNLKAL